jgi:iron uptake system EfeUOB component EfeO/EfeM
MGFHELQYKKLLSELKFKNEELEIIEESMHEIHMEFEEYYNDFLKRNNLSKAELEKAKTPQFEQFKKERAATMPETDETGIVVLEQDTEEDKEAKVVFSKLYKQIVKKCHPDRLSQDDMEYFNKMNTRFKAATWGFNNGKWSIVIKIAEELGIKPSNYKKMNGHLRREVKDLDKKLKHFKTSYGYMLYEAEDESSKDNIIKNFIFALFRRRL